MPALCGEKEPIDELYTVTWRGSARQPETKFVISTMFMRGELLVGGVAAPSTEVPKRESLASAHATVNMSTMQEVDAMQVPVASSYEQIDDPKWPTSFSTASCTRCTAQRKLDRPINPIIATLVVMPEVDANVVVG